MPRRNLVPGELPNFDIYIRSAVGYLLEEETPGNPRWKRLGVKTAEMNKATAYRDEWYTGNPAAPGAYELHTKPGTKTKVTRSAIEGIMKKFTPFFSNVVKCMTPYKYTSAEKLTLHIPERKETNTKRVKILEFPVALAQALDGSRVKIRVRIGAQEGRPRKHPQADCIELVYFIGDNPPGNAAGMREHSLSTKAIIIFDAGAKNSRKLFTAYVRYLNTSNPNLSSGWSNRIEVMIS